VLVLVTTIIESVLEIPNATPSSSIVADRVCGLADLDQPSRAARRSRRNNGYLSPSSASDDCNWRARKRINASNHTVSLALVFASPCATWKIRGAAVFLVAAQAPHHGAGRGFDCTANCSSRRRNSARVKNWRVSTRWRSPVYFRCYGERNSFIAVRRPRLPLFVPTSLSPIQFAQPILCDIAESPRDQLER